MNGYDEPLPPPTSDEESEDELHVDYPQGEALAPEEYVPYWEPQIEDRQDPGNSNESEEQDDEIEETPRISGMYIARVVDMHGNEVGAANVPPPMDDEIEQMDASQNVEPGRLDVLLSWFHMICTPSRQKIKMMIVVCIISSVLVQEPAGPAVDEITADGDYSVVNCEEKGAVEHSICVETVKNNILYARSGYTLSNQTDEETEGDTEADESTGADAQVGLLNGIEKIMSLIKQEKEIEKQEQEIKEKVRQLRKQQEELKQQNKRCSVTF
eukprot:UN22700